MSLTDAVAELQLICDGHDIGKLAILMQCEYAMARRRREDRQDPVGPAPEPEPIRNKYSPASYDSARAVVEAARTLESLLVGEISVAGICKECGLSESTAKRATRVAKKFGYLDAGNRLTPAGGDWLEAPPDCS